MERRSSYRVKRGKRVDGNQAAIVEALRTAGAEVQSLASIGHGCPDLLVAYDGEWFVAEVKQPDGTFTPAELIWHGRFGQRAMVFVLRTSEDALRMIGEMG